MKRFIEAWKDPSLEVWRALLPFWVFWSLIPAMAVLPLTLLMTLVDFSLWKLALIVPVLSFAASAVLFGLPEALGRLSGYRPFKTSWTIPTSSEAGRQAAALRRAARSRGFEVSWETLLGGFVAVHGRERALQDGLTHSARKSPIRLFFDLVETSSDRFQARLEVQVCTCVVWDTGERERLEELGKKLLKAVGQQR